MIKVAYKYVKPLNDELSITHFENSFGIKYPADLKDALEKNNGGRPTVNIFDTDKTQGRVFNSFLSFNQSDGYNIYDVVDVLWDENKALLPFACDPFGNFLCIFHDNVVFWLHETNTCEYVADSFTDFIEKLYA